jgi:ADP-heptose:LPS heptosyltransferase
MKTKKLYVSTGGGLGDTIYNYFCKKDWKSISSIKEIYPEIEIMAIFHSHCKEASSIACFNPFIDSTLSYRWYGKGNKKKFNWKQLLAKDIIPVKRFINKNKIEAKRNKIYLSPTEQIQFNKLTQQPYIVLTPFAGSSRRTFLPLLDPNRHCLPQETFIELANEQSKKIQVIILGQSKTINDHHCNKGTTITGLDSGILNLINKASVRLTTELVRNAKAFVGTHSSQLVAAWTNNVPSVYFYPTLEEKGKSRTIEQDGGRAGTFKMHLPIHYGFERSAKGFEKLTTKEISNKLNEVIETACKK